MNEIPPDIQATFDSVIAGVNRCDDYDMAQIRKALEGAWADQRRQNEKSCLIESRERMTFYHATMKLQTRGSKSRWVVDLKVDKF